MSVFVSLLGCSRCRTPAGTASRTQADKLRSKRAKLLSDKAALAARFDYFSAAATSSNVSDTATVGTALHRRLQSQLASWACKNAIQIQPTDKVATEVRTMIG